MFDFVEAEQVKIDEKGKEYDKRLNLMKTVGKLRDKYGAGVMQRGLSLKDKKLNKEGERHGGSLPPARK